MWSEKCVTFTSFGRYDAYNFGIYGAKSVREKLPFCKGAAKPGEKPTVRNKGKTVFTAKVTHVHECRAGGSRSMRMCGLGLRCADSL